MKIALILPSHNEEKKFDDINLTAVDFAVNAETGLLPLIKGYKIAEIPVKWKER